MIASDVFAAGFHLREQSAAGQGNAFAGATAGAENASYSYFNVAGLTRQKGTQLNLGATYIAPKAQASDIYGEEGKRGSDVNNIVHASWAPNMNISRQINEKTFIGLGLNVPFGMITKYDAEWPGADHGITSKVKAISATPMFAYKATDKLSLGAGLQIQYIKARLTNAIDQMATLQAQQAAKKLLRLSSSDVKVTGNTAMEGEALDLGYALGALYEFSPKTRVGLAYRSEVKHKLRGDIKGTLPMPLVNQDISARLTTPAMLSMGIYHELNDKWAVMAEYQRVFWSSFAKLNIRGDKQNQPSGYISTVQEKWRDTNFFAIGASYQIDNQWKWRLGLAYDQSAARLNHRTPRIPDSDRVWYSTGLNYQYNDRLSFDVAYTYIYAHKAHLDTSLTRNLGYNVTAEYSNSVQLFGLSLNYKF